MTESNAERFKRVSVLPPNEWSINDTEFMVDMAEERVMIEEHRLSIHAPYSDTLQGWLVASTKLPRTEYEHASFSTAIRSVVAKLGEGNG